MKKQLSVAVIGTRGYPSFYGGFETAVRYIAPDLATKGWSVIVYGRRRQVQAGVLGPDSRIQSVVTRGMETRSLSTLTYGLTSTLHTIFVTRPDVALVMNVANGYWLPLLKLARIPTVVNVDGIEWERAKWSNLGKAVFKVGAKLTAMFADTIVADAKSIASRWRTEFNRDGVFIPYGGTVRQGLPVPDGLESGAYVLFVARFVPENTTREFFEAVPSIAATHRVVIVGSSGYGGPFEETAARLASEFENVEWAGHLSDDDRLHSLWQHAGVYFHGHSVGGTNPALVQAIACGAPVVARDTVFNREVLESNAVYVEPDATSISFHVLELLADKQRAHLLADGARRRAAEDYSWESVCDRYERALRAACDEGESNA